MLCPSDSPSLVSASEAEPLVTPFPSRLLPSQSPIRKTVCLKVSKEFAQTFGSVRTPSLEEHQVLVVQKLESGGGQNGKMRKQTWAGKKWEIKSKTNDNQLRAGLRRQFPTWSRSGFVWVRVHEHLLLWVNMGTRDQHQYVVLNRFSMFLIKHVFENHYIYLFGACAHVCVPRPRRLLSSLVF